MIKQVFTDFCGRVLDTLHLDLTIPEGWTCQLNAVFYLCLLVHAESKTIHASECHMTFRSTFHPPRAATNNRCIIDSYQRLLYTFTLYILLIDGVLFLFKGS